MLVAVMAATAAWSAFAWSAAAPARAASLPGAHRSPLERSPGYYPPADPESASVRLGRRKAKPVRLLLSGGSRSIDDLAQRLLAGLEAKDENALHACRLTRSEFALICWPEFPESRPITRITADDAWELSDPTSVAGASRALSMVGGRPLSFVSVHATSREAYRNFVLHRGVVIEARDESGSMVSLRFAPSVVERRGRFKVLMFKD